MEPVLRRKIRIESEFEVKNAQIYRPEAKVIRKKYLHKKIYVLTVKGTLTINQSSANYPPQWVGHPLLKRAVGFSTGY